MKTSTLVMRLMLAALFLTVLIYFGVNMTAYFMDPYTINVAYRYTGERAVTVSGYVVREEEVLTGGSELVYSSRSEGERVSAGGTVALTYQNPQALENANSLRALEDQLSQLRYAQSLSVGNQTSARLDDEITSALVHFRSALSSGDLNDAGECGIGLRTAVLKRSYAYSGTEDLDAAIASLEAQISSLSAQTDPGTSRISAPRSGLFSSLVDGYETVLDPTSILSLTPAGYQTIAPTGTTGGVGKMIYGASWSFLTMMRSEDIGHLAVGDAITLRFQKGMSQDMSMRVAYISAEEQGQRVVVFTSSRYLSLTTLLRQQNAQVIFESYSGVRVPRSAVRVDAQPLTDEDGAPLLDASGQPRTQSVTCVYCLWGDTARYKPVEVLWQEEEYILAQADETALSQLSSDQARESRRLRAGDQVITAAADLYDGKVIR